MQETMENRCEQQADHRDEGHATEKRVEPGEQVKLAEMTHVESNRIRRRTFPGQNHRREVKGLSPTQSTQVMVAQHPYEQAAANHGQRDDHASRQLAQKGLAAWHRRHRQQRVCVRHPGPRSFLQVAPDYTFNVFCGVITRARQSLNLKVSPGEHDAEDWYDRSTFLQQEEKRNRR